MPAPSDFVYSAAALVEAQTSFRNLIDSGSGAGFVQILTEADVVLAQIPLTDPCGTVNGTTGRLTITPASAPNAIAGGDATWGRVCNSAGTVYLSLPAQAGTTPVTGRLVLNTLTILSGNPVELLSITIG